MEKQKRYKLTIFADLKDFPREVSEIDGDFIGDEGYKEARSYGLKLMRTVMEEDRHFLKDRGATASMYPYRTINAIHMVIGEIDEDGKEVRSKQREEIV